jgi:hypothetical protein
MQPQARNCMTLCRIYVAMHKKTKTFQTHLGLTFEHYFEVEHYCYARHATPAGPPCCAVPRMITITAGASQLGRVRRVRRVRRVNRRVHAEVDEGLLGAP